MGGITMDTLLADKDSKLHFVDPSTSSEDYTGFTTAAVKWRGKSICKHSKKKDISATIAAKGARVDGHVRGCDSRKLEHILRTVQYCIINHLATNAHDWPQRLTPLQTRDEVMHG